MHTIWEMKEENNTLCSSTIEKHELNTVVSQILCRRMITSPEELHLFLYGTLDDEYDPYLMKGMSEAVVRIEKAIADKERILIHGDYDVDGVTAAALLAKTFDELGAEYSLYLPERLKGGYGVSQKAIYYAREMRAGLIVTVDCGISAYDEVRLANQYGIDVVITDHHQPLREPFPLE